MHHMTSFFSRISTFSTGTKILIISSIIIISVGGAYGYSASRKQERHTVTVTRGSLTERVDLTGSVAPVGTVSLAFQRNGIITSVEKQVGDTVHTGDILSSLDIQSLKTQLDLAQAGVDSAQAKLSALKAGATKATVAVSKTALLTAQKTLAGSYSSAVSTLIDSYARANDAVRTNLNVFFNNPETENPTLVFTSSASQAALDSKYERGSLNRLFSSWHSELSQITASSSHSKIISTLDTSLKNLSQIARFLNNLSTATINASSFQTNSSLTATNAKTIVANSINTIRLAIANVITIQNTISTQEALVKEDKARLNETLQKATPEAIAEQQASVNASKAKVDNIKIELSQSVLRSPITGTVSIQNAKVGQTVSANQPVTTVFSSNALEVDVNMPEVDIGKVAVGNNVDITFDAFPNETFKGTVFSIDPAETITGGVVGYKTKIHFIKSNPRIKSGLTANVSIITAKKVGVLYLPQYAIIQTDEGSFIKTLTHGSVIKAPVTTGIRDDHGNIEILSGVVDGEKVLNIGLKSGS